MYYALLVLLTGERKTAKNGCNLQPSYHFQNYSIYPCTKIKTQKRKQRYYKDVKKGLYRAHQLMQAWHCNTSGMQLGSLMAVVCICKFEWYVTRSVPKLSLEKHNRFFFE